MDAESPEFMVELQRITRPQPAKKKKPEKDSDGENSDVTNGLARQVDTERLDKIVLQELQDLTSLEPIATLKEPTQLLEAG